MVDLEAAIGYVVAHGDPVERARLSWLRSGVVPSPEIFDKVEAGQTGGGGWPAVWGGDIASIDATCFRLAELDNLGGLDRPAARLALDWLASCQRPDGGWDEDPALAEVAPQWAQPGDPEARLFLTTTAAYWLAVGGPPEGGRHHAGPSPEQSDRVAVVTRAAEAFRAALRPDGTWPSFLATGWLGAAVLYHLGWFHAAAPIWAILIDRLPEMTPGDCAQLGAAMVRIGVADDALLEPVRRRLVGTQRSGGGWPAEDSDDALDVDITLTAMSALR